MSAAHLRVFGGDGAEPAPLDCSFEEAERRLNALPRMFFEPDGSFVWRGESPQVFQWDGELYDAGGRVQHVELRGRGGEALRQLLEALGDVRDLRVQHVADGRVLPAGEFLRDFTEPASG